MYIKGTREEMKEKPHFISLAGRLDRRRSPFVLLPRCRYHLGGARPSYIPDTFSWYHVPASTAPLPFEVPHRVKADLDLYPPNKLISFGAKGEAVLFN